MTETPTPTPTPDLSEILRAHRHQLVSSSGLTVLFVATLAALGHGLISPLAMAAACLPPFFAGLTIAAVKRWQGMALVAVGGALAALLVATSNKTPPLTLFIGLVTLLAATLALCAHRRWLWPLLAAVVAAFSLIVVWTVGMNLGSPLLLVGVTVTWLASALAAAQRRLLDDARGAMALAIGGAAAALAIATSTILVSPAAAAVAGLLLVSQGLAQGHLLCRRCPSAPPLLLMGLALGAFAAYGWLGFVGLGVALGALSLLLLLLSRRAESPLLTSASLGVVALQALVMLFCHPALAHQPSLHWHLWSLGALAITVQLVFVHLGCRQREGEPASFAAWRRECLFFLQALYVLAALSTELSLLVRWLPALTLLWTAAAAALWLLGRRAPSLRVAAVLSVAAALVKLLAFDWALLSGGIRVALLLVVGTTMLITPLLAAEGEQPVRHRDAVLASSTEHDV